MDSQAAISYDGCHIPPEIYDIAFAWDPRPEVERLLFLARESGITPRSALELGCGTARLFPTMGERVPDLVGIELHPVMAERASARLATPGCKIVVGDMSDFSLGRTFDLIYSSANTIRHIIHPDKIERMFRCIANHLTPSGVFIADLEFGVAAEAGKVDIPATWFMAKDDVLVHVSWNVRSAPEPTTRICEIEWIFEVRDGAPAGTWRESFPLRAYDADEFISLATRGGGLVGRGVFEIREPYLCPTEPERAIGRHMAVVQRAS